MRGTVNFSGASLPFIMKKVYKCSTASCSLKIGVSSESMNELIDMGCSRLKISRDSLLHISLDDGTIIEDEDYFQSISPNSVVYFVQQSARGRPPVRVSDSIRNALTLLTSLPKEKLLSACEELSSHKYAQLLDAIVKDRDAADHMESREQDPSWFDGVKMKATTKSAVMEHNAHTRIRGYLFEARKKVQESDLMKKQKEELLSQLAVFQKQLVANKWNCHYFSRTSTHEDRFCNRDGWFSCEGVYSEPICTKRHLINPYASKEERIIFSTWNLDHRIEKSREILPTMLELVKKGHPSKSVHWQYFYQLLFTRDNLKLVHIVCHDKREHASSKCDPTKIFV